MMRHSSKLDDPLTVLVQADPLGVHLWIAFGGAVQSKLSVQGRRQVAWFAKPDWFR